MCGLCAKSIFLLSFLLSCVKIIARGFVKLYNPNAVLIGTFTTKKRVHQSPPNFQMEVSMSGQENYRISVLSAGRGETVELVLGYIAEEVARRKERKRSDEKKNWPEDLEVIFNLDGQEGIFLEEGARRTSLRPIRFSRGEDGRVCFCALPIRREESDKRLKSFAVNFVATYFVKGSAQK